MKKLSDSALLKEMLFSNKLSSNLRAIDINRDALPLEKLIEPLNVINKKLNFGTKGKIFSYLNSGKIVIINNPEISLPKYMSVFGRINNGEVISVIDISKYCKTFGGNIDIFPKTLYGLIQSGMVYQELTSNWNRYTMNIEFIRNGAISYSRLVGKVLDKIFAINIDPVKSDLVHFYLAKFYLINLCDKSNNDTMNNIAVKSCFNDSRIDMLLEIEKEFTEDAYDNIFNLFENLKKIRGLENLKIRSFVENWVRMYGEGTILALDYLPAFISMIFSVCVGAGLHKDYLIDSVASKSNARVFVEFIKLMK